VRCSATGISAIFDNHGTLIGEIPLFTRGVLAAEVQPMQGLTLFVKYGDWWVGLCALILAAACALARHKVAHEELSKERNHSSSTQATAAKI
jgi:apolipoprotein N-acyltransferase